MEGKKRIGDAGESLGAAFLESRGMKILARGYRCRAGELDIVASDGEAIRFVEVKTRGNLDFGRPCEAVNRKKQSHMKAAALEYMYREHPPEKECAFDVIEIGIEHIKGAF